MGSENAMKREVRHKIENRIFVSPMYQYYSA